MRTIPHRFIRDWRIKTLVPVVLINLAAFAALYFFMYHFAVSNLVRTEKVAGAVLLDELELTLPDMMRDTTGNALRSRMAREAAMHNLVDMNVFDAQGRAVVTAYDEPSAAIRGAVRQAILSRDRSTRWIVLPAERTFLVGIHPLPDGVGALQMSIDLTAPMRAARERVRSRFVFAGAAWIALLALMFWTGGVVIGRPLKKIRDTLKSDKEQDLDALANQVHETIWQLIETQRQRESDIVRQMARTKQLAALGEVAAGLTHEIKNPLAGVIAALEIVRTESDAHGELVDQMLAELRRVTGTLDSLLRLARPQPPQRTEVDLARTVRDLSAIFVARFRRSGVELDVQTADSAPKIALDSGMMAQLIVNLLTNSLQATDRGGKVTVQVAPFPRHDGVLLVVSDTGCGIAQEHMQQIFDPFFTTKEDGTGLGMAICRQIVTQHGGTISIESEVGKGTRVIVPLPAQEEERDALAAAG